MPQPPLAGTPVLVTGGAGFIGSHLVEALVREGALVRVLDDLATGSLENLAPVSEAIDFVEGDIRDLATCRQACQGVHLVFHQAALGSVPRSLADPATTFAVNVAGTANVFSAARDAGCERLVYASSSSVYGDSERLPKREGEEGEPLSPYALSKAMNEQTARVFSRCFRLESVGLRYFNVYGPRQDPEGPYAAVIPRMFRACVAGEPVTIHGDGEQSRDFTFVADAVAANLLAAGASPAATGRAYNVAAGRRTTVNRLAELIGELAGSGADPVHGPPRPGDVRHSQADPETARRELGLSCRVDLEAGLSVTAEHYLGQSARQTSSLT